MSFNRIITTIPRSTRAFSLSAQIRSEGAPSGKAGSSNPLGKREKAEEERYIHEQEMNKLRSKIEKSKKDLEKMETEAKELGEKHKAS